MYLCYARDDTCYIPESRINVEYEGREQNDDIVRENPAQLCEDQTLVFLLGFANGGKPHHSLRLGASFRLRYSYRVVLLLKSLLIFVGF